MTKKQEQSGVISQATTPRELIILAMGPTRSQCPYDAETWGVNNGYKQVREAKGHLDKLFLAHTQVKDAEGDNIFNWEEINSLGIEVINTHRVKGLKSKIFPMKRIVEKFGVNYFSDSICYMIVYALDQATKKNLELRYPMRIRLYGADMHTKDEYALEKPAIEYWIGYARGLGIKVEISEGSALFKTITGKPYGERLKNDNPNILFESYVNAFFSPMSGAYVGTIPDEVLDKIVV